MEEGQLRQVDRNMKLSTPIRVRVESNYNGINDAHAIGEKPLCKDRYFSDTATLVMPAEAFVKWKHSCHECARSVASAIDNVFAEFTDYETELESPFGRTPVQMFEEEGLVDEAVKRFPRRESHIAAALAGVPLSDALDVMQERFTSPQVSLFCKKCGTEYRRLVSWPRVQGLTLKCKDCTMTTEYDFDEYVPDVDCAKNTIENVESRGRRRNFDEVSDHHLDPEPAVTSTEVDEPVETLIYRSEERLSAHKTSDDGTACGRDLYGESVMVYELRRVNECGNCKNVTKQPA